MLVKIDTSSFKPEELMKTVAVPTNPLTEGGLLLGIDESKDLANTYFAGWSAYKKSMENGVLDIGDLMNLLNLSLTLPALITNIKLIPFELHDLNFEELATLVAVADNYDLGDYKQTAQNMFVALVYFYKSLTKVPDVNPLA